MIESGSSDKKIQATSKGELEKLNAEVDSKASGGLAEQGSSGQQLSKEYKLLRTVIDNIPDRIFVKDTESRFILYNKAVADWWGHGSTDKLLGKSDFDLYCEEYARKYYDDEQGVMKSGEPILSQEATGTDRMGNQTHCLVSRVPLEDESGRVFGIVGIGREITERKRAEQSLRASEEKYRSIFETAANLITSVNRDGVFVDCNGRVKDILGYERDEIIGESIEKTIHPDYLDKAREALDEILRTGRSYNKEYKMVRKDGEVIDVRVNSSGLKDDTGEYVRTICILSLIHI